MAARRRQERIEPRFEDLSGRSDDEIRISADDRAVPSAANDPRRKSAKSAKPGKSKAVSSASSRRTGGRDGSGSGAGGGGRRRRRSFLGHIFRLGITASILGAIAVVCVLGYVAATLPQEAWAIPDRPPNVKIVSVDGELLANRGLTGGAEVSLDEISPYIPQAVIAIEDRRFYDHWGVDPIGIVRAFFTNMQAGETVQGGSTLTQQLAKNIFLTPDQTLKRKIQEAVLALWLEHKFTKDQILEMYLNRVYFGSGATGVEAAARRYFNKSAADVDLGQAALLAGLLKAPSRLSPARDPDAAKARAEVVLAAMRDEGAISGQEYADAKAQKPTKAKSYWNGAENYAADIVMRDIKTLVGDVKHDVVVETTIDRSLEKKAEAVVRGTISGANRNVSQGALVALDGTGAIRALVGGKDYAASQFNRAVDAKRQPGSAFKPFVYEAALEKGLRPESVVVDGPVQIGNWSPENYERSYKGPVTLAYALTHSINTVAAKLANYVGPATVIDVAKRLGIASKLEDNASIALGTSEVSLLELTGAYATYANGGYRGDAASGQQGHRHERQDHLGARRRSAAGHRRARDRRRDERHAVESRDVGNGAQVGDSRLAVGRQDRHHSGLQGRLVRRLHGQSDRRRLARQRQRRQDEEGHRRLAAGRGLARFHGRRPRRPAGRPAAGRLQYRQPEPGPAHRRQRRRSRGRLLATALMPTPATTITPRPASRCRRAMSAARAAAASSAARRLPA